MFQKAGSVIPDWIGKHLKEENTQDNKIFFGYFCF